MDRQISKLSYQVSATPSVIYSLNAMHGGMSSDCLMLRRATCRRQLGKSLVR